MNDYEIIFKVDGEEISQEAIRAKERERYNVAFEMFYRVGVTARLNNRKLTLQDCKALSLKQAADALGNLKEDLGREGIPQILSTELAAGDAAWREISENSESFRNLQPGLVEVEAHGITLPQFMMVNQQVARENSVNLASHIHPEHYYFQSGKGSEQTIVETFGMWGHPVMLHLVPGKNLRHPIELDRDTMFAMQGTTRLASDETDTKIVGMHQIKERADGSLAIKMGVFVPEAAPAEVAEGHKWHMLVEFNNVLHMAATQHPNMLQRAAMNFALKQMAKQFGR